MAPGAIQPPPNGMGCHGASGLARIRWAALAEQAGGTRHEQAGKPTGTRREGSRDAGGTRREGAGGGEAGGATRRERPPGYVSVNLPDGLKARFTVVDELATQGVEATVLVVDEVEPGERRVLKLYHRHIQLDRDAVEKALALSEDDDGRHHIVRLYEVDVEAGLWYEVQEYCEQESLRTVLGSGQEVDAGALARELAEALVFLEGRLYLRDLKPENLLVRTLEPFDIVVTDFGLMRDASAGSVRWTELGGTFAYMPPEAGRRRLTPAWDWWSGGMVIAEVALGRHPLVDDEGRMPPELQIMDLLHNQPVDVSGIADERLRHLCQGLLVRDDTQRWRREQVAAWLAGEDPVVPSDATAQAAGSTGVTSEVAFGGATFDDPVELAAAFQQRWDYAIERLFQERDADWLAEVDTFLRAYRLTRAAQIVAERVESATDLPRRLAELLIEMDPALDPTFNGLSITPAGLADAAHAVAAGERSGLQRQLTQIREARALSLWSSLPGMTHAGRKAAEVEATWLRDCLELEQLAKKTRVGETVPAGEALERAKARLLLCAIDPKALARIRRDVRKLQTKKRQVPAWWNLAEQAPTSTPAAVLALILAPEAEFVTAEQQRRAAEARGDAPARGVTAQRARLTDAALGHWMTPPLSLFAIALIVAPLWIAARYELKIQYFMAITEAQDKADYPFSIDVVHQAAAAKPWIIAIAVALAVVQAAGIRLEQRALRPAAARTFAVTSAAVQAAAAAAATVGAALALLLAYIAVVHDDQGFPDGYVPGGYAWLAVVVPVAIAGPIVLLVCLYRLAAALLGSEVTRP